MEQDVLTAINRLSGKGVFDIVFIDAPYGMGYDKSTLTALANSNIIDEYTTVIVEEKLDADVSYVSELGFKLNKIKNYKTNKHIFVSLEKIGD